MVGFLCAGGFLSPYCGRNPTGQVEEQMDGNREQDYDERRETAQYDPSLYLNRELSWLDFNDRVLQLAEDPRVPLLERVKFCAIYTTNLDEYYMVRVAGLRDQIDACLLYTSPSPRDRTRSRMPSSA